MSIRILLGRTRALRREALARDAFGSTDALGRPTFLYVTDSVRKAQLVEREFNAYKDRRAFSPRTSTLAALLERMAVAHGDGRVPWTGQAAALVAERLLETRGGEWLRGLGDPVRVGADLAALRDAWAEAGRPALAGRHGPEIVEFLGRLTESLDAAAERVSASTLLAQLARRLDSVAEGGPQSGSLGSWLRREPAVVIDDVLHPSPLRRQLLVKLCRAWSATGAHVVVSFESGRDLGGREVEAFFEYGDEDEIGLSLRAFQATRAMRRDCFEGLVAVGGAEIVVATTEGPVAPEERDGVDAGGPVGLADALDTGARATWPDAVRFVQWPAPVDEVRGIAEAVKGAILAGAKPGDCWVSFPGLPAYAPLVRRAFASVGVPCTISTGTPAAELPAGRWLRDLVHAATADFPVGVLLAACASGLSGAVDATSALGLARVLREHGVTAFPPAWPAPLLAAIPPALRPALDALGALRASLAPLAGPIEPKAWADTLRRVGEQHAVLERIEASPVEAGARARSAQAWAAALGAIDGAARAAADARPGPWPGMRLARLLDEALAGARLPEPAAEGRVQVVGILELRGIHPPHLWIGGLVADDFPAREGGDYLVAPASRRSLDLPDRGAEARFLLASAVRNAEAGGHRLTLSWPSARDGNECARSPVVEEMLRIRLEAGPGSEEGATAAGKVEQAVPSLVAHGPADVDRAVGAAHGRGADAAAWAPLGRGTEAYAALAAPARARAGDAFGPYDGILRQPPQLPGAVGVSRFESYLACPARAWYAMLLGVDPEEDYDPDLDPGERGNLLHDVLRRFVEGLHASDRRGVAGADPARSAEAAGLLRAAVDEAMAHDPGVARLPPRLREARRRALAAGLDGQGPRGVLAEWLRQRIDDPPGTEMHAAEWGFARVDVGPLALRGRADRVDLLPGGAVLVVDYKTGKPPADKRIAKGLVAQGVVYAAAAKAAHGVPAAAVYQGMGKADEVARKGWVGEDAALAAAAAGRNALNLDQPAGRAVRDHLERAAEKLAAGRFHTTLAGADDAGCKHCDFRQACRVDHARNARIAAGDDARWLRPIPGAS